jgi:ABC-type transport system involved in multi-copper enzyme maturation permease subunit
VILTLLRRQLRHQRALILALVSGMVFFQILIISIGNAMDETGGVADILARLPTFIQNFIKTQIGEVSFRAFAAFGFEHPATMGSSLAYVVFLCTIPSGERDAGLLDLFLARPLSRRQYMSATVVHLIATAVILPACLLLGVAIGLAIVDSENALQWSRYAPASFGLTSLLLAWGGIALFLGAGGQRRGVTVVQMIAALATTFLLHVLGQMSTMTDWIEWVSPFEYFNPLAGSVQQRPWIPDASILLAVFAVTTIGAFVRFEKRDI